MNIKACDVWQLAKNVYGKYAYSKTGENFPPLFCVKIQITMNSLSTVSLSRLQQAKSWTRDLKGCLEGNLRGY
jgi:hypothetical protein